jgi:small neutral amino acid transporter SnatA (MarC family)
MTYTRIISLIKIVIFALFIVSTGLSAYSIYLDMVSSQSEMTARLIASSIVFLGFAIFLFFYYLEYIAEKFGVMIPLVSAIILSVT